MTHCDGNCLLVDTTSGQDDIDRQSSYLEKIKNQKKGWVPEMDLK